MFDHLHKSLYGKRIVLGGDAEFFLQVSVFSIFALKNFVLVIDLSNIAQKLCSVICQRHSASAPMEDQDAGFALEFLNCACQRRLCDVEKFRCLIERSRLGDRDHIMHLLKCHRKLLS